MVIIVKHQSNCADGLGFSKVMTCQGLGILIMMVCIIMHTQKYYVEVQHL